MNFSVGLFDALFGEKVMIEIPNNGTTIKRTVSKKWMEKMQNEGKVNKLITANILNPITGITTEGWAIDTNISREMYEKFKDDNGEIYAMVIFENGKPGTHILKKELWETTKKQMEDI